jgi:two-component system sensor histidine kinase KdpD
MRAGALGLGGRRLGPGSGLAAAIVGAALATLAVYPLQQLAPVVSLSVVYLPPVLLVSTLWGLPLGLICSLLSALAFNFFHLPPTGQFTIADRRDWVALAAFAVVAAVASTIAELARARAVEAERRKDEADLAAALARELLLEVDTATALANAARRIAAAVGLASAAIELGPERSRTVASRGPSGGGDRRQALILHDADGAPIGRLIVPAELPGETEGRLHGHVVPVLEALVALARRRDLMQAEVVETAALRRSDDIKTALLRAVSHDLRTPLTSIVAAGHALGGSRLQPAERAELSGAVVSEGTRLAGLVDNLLALSRLQAGRATPSADWVSVEDLVAAAAEGLRDGLADIRLQIDPDVPELRADAAQLERALANLLENAERYGGGRPVSVHARSAANQVLISIVDQGPGIAPAEQARIFEPFYRGRAPAVTAWTGSGLGLAIARGFVEANGGTVTVDSLPGQGARFQISLPADEASARAVRTGPPVVTPSP